MRIGLFGCGNMGATLAQGFNQFDPSIEQYFFAPSQTRAQNLAIRLGGNFIERADDMPRNLDWYVLAFKPQSLNDFRYDFLPDSKILSVLAGTGIEKLSKKFNSNFVARLMPNTPSAIGVGANLLYTHFEATPLIKMLESLGKLFLMESEVQLDAMTAFSGSGPALLFEFARLFEKHMSAIAGNNIQAREIITQTFLGSAKLMELAVKEEISFEALREQVTSKKGVTEEALKILEKNGLDNILGGAFLAAHKRTLEIKKGI